MEEVKKRIPHRDPFLFADRIVEQTESAIVVERKVREEEFFFKGHYPGNPILPGVLLCEAMFQAGAILMSFISGSDSGVPVVTRADKVKFRKIVKPGDVLMINTVYTEKIGPAYCFKANVRMDGKVAASCEFMCALVPEV